ncbi:MAG: LLM class flavin-dependent oxidoreductase [Ilumatobacter sp.]|uniref:LLM class flavin-dependent oxidoreductase n=1 Tax=Ilumatobacter sp. TaxID=1967498 RepID=UPI00329A5CAC
MEYGFVVPWGDAADIGDLAEAAEEAGWGGLFVWEPVWGVDAWISLALAAVRTSRIRLGTMLTPPSRRRPWELASQVATVDRLSNGRVTLSVGLGAIDSGFEAFGEECGKRERAELMDECLDIVCGLWAGQPFSHSGEHYRIEPTEFPTIGHVEQSPRVPIWCVGALGKPRSMARALRWDGVIPQVLDPGTDGGARQPSLLEVADLRDTIEAGPNPGADIIVEGQWTEHSPAAYADAGATWWIESMWGAMSEHSPVTAAYDRLKQGPPA